MEQYYLYNWNSCHYGDVIMGGIVSQITSLMIVYSTVYSDADQRKYQSSMSLAFVRGIHQGPVNSPHKWPVTRKMFLFDDVFIVLVREHLYNDLGPPPAAWYIVPTAWPSSAFIRQDQLYPWIQDQMKTTIKPLK